MSSSSSPKKQQDLAIQLNLGSVHGNERGIREFQWFWTSDIKIWNSERNNKKSL